MGISMSLLSEANKIMRAGNWEEALRKYDEVAMNFPHLRALVQGNIKIILRRIELEKMGLNLLGNKAPESIEGSPLVPASLAADAVVAVTVTLTSIRSRLENLVKVIESLHQQRLMPQRIELYLSELPYLLDEGVSRNDPLVQALEQFPLVKVVWVENTGPYRKILPFLQGHFDASPEEEKLFVTVDDDTLYPEYFLSTLYEKYLEHDCVVAFRGRHIEMSGAAIPSYSEWTQGKADPVLSNVPTGKDGILYSTKFFTREFLDMAAARSLAPTGDDLWIRWHCAMNGVPALILNPEACTSDYKSFPVVDYSREYRSNSLYSLHNSAGAQGKNDVSVAALEEHFIRRFGYNLRSILVGDYSGGGFSG